MAPGQLVRYAQPMVERAGGERRRETRLLLATIAVSVGVLLLLARFRFPEELARPPDAEPVPPPLERLAARATYEELAGIMADLERRVVPAIVTLRAQGDRGTVSVVAVRIGPDRAVGLMAGALNLIADEGASEATVVMRDPEREVVVVATQPRPDAVPTLPGTVTRSGPRYVAVVEATGGNPAVRPVYIGRADLIPDPRWSDPLLSIAAVQQTVTSGSAVFLLDGTFLGLATENFGRVTVVPGSTLRAFASASAPSPSPAGALPLEVQSLTPDLARATGSDRGVVVSFVAESAGADLRSGDVIRSLDGMEISTVVGFLQTARSRRPGAAVTLDTVRRGEPRKVTVTALPAGTQPLSPSGLGAVLRAVPETGAEVVTVERGSAAERGGLTQGDLVIALDGAQRPDPAVVLKAYAGAKPGTTLLLTVRRGAGYRVLAVEKR